MGAVVWPPCYCSQLHFKYCLSGCARLRYQTSLGSLPGLWARKSGMREGSAPGFWSAGRGGGGAGWSTLWPNTAPVPVSSTVVKLRKWVPGQANSRAKSHTPNPGNVLPPLWRSPYLFSGLVTDSFFSFLFTRLWDVVLQAVVCLVKRGREEGDY